MEGLYSLLEGQRNMEPIMLPTQESSSAIPLHLMNIPQIGNSSQGSMNINLACCSSHQFFISSVLESILDEKYIEETLIPSKLLSHKHGLYAMNENDRGENDRRQHRNLNEAIRGKSLYRGVIKCNDQRFEAYVWDNTDPGENGRAVYVGSYFTEVDAARAHDLVSVKIGGLEALTNFPARCYWNEMDEIQGMSTRDYISVVRRMGKDYSDVDSPYRGVYSDPMSRKWEARIGREGSPTMLLGSYYTPEDAARAFDIISIKMKGGGAITNFDLNSYEVDGIMESQITQAMDGSIILQKEGSNNEAEAYPQTRSLVQQNPQQLTNSSFCHCCQNHNLISSNPYALGSHGGVFPNQRATLQQLLQTVTSHSSNHGNSFGNHAAQFPNQNATLQQPLQTQQSQVNANNGFNQNLVNYNNNQFLPQSSNLPVLAHGTQNLELGKCVRFPDWPSGFGKKLLGGDLELERLSNNAALNVQPLAQVMVNENTESTNGVCSFGSQIQPVGPSNQEFGATQLQFPEVNQSYEPYNYNANTLNQIPHQNLKSSSSDSFQNPISEPNNNGSQGQTSGSQIDLDMRDYLNRSYIEDNDFACDFDMFGAMNRQGL